MAVVIDKSQISQGVIDFFNGESVKVVRALKKEFHNALSRKSIDDSLEGWSSTITPLRYTYKFERTEHKPINL